MIADRYATAASEAPGLATPLTVFDQLQRAPESVGELQLAEACHEVFAWAEERSLIRTAMHFAELAAHADLGSAARCNVAGRACRAAGEHTRSHDWYERGFKIAKSGERRALINTAVRSLLGLGRLLQVQGRPHEAARYFKKAVKRSTRRDRRALAAEANHDLFAVLAELGQYPMALVHARGAVDFYGPKHPRFPYAAHDFAFLLIRCLYFRPALELLQMLPRYFTRPEEAALVWSTQAWAAAASGERERFLVAEERTVRAIGPATEYSAPAMTHLAEAARATGEWERAERYAQAAADAAREWGDTGTERESRELLQAIRMRQQGAATLNPKEAELAELVQTYKARLRRWKGPTPGARPPPAR
ncbi:MAG TPA: tetratricopeptide repeat protein [Longimicrobium sp.]